MFLNVLLFIYIYYLFYFLGGDGGEVDGILSIQQSKRRLTQM